MAKSDWTEEQILRMEQLYNDLANSLQGIANVMGLSKNSVLGKIHRLHIRYPGRFLPRPSPIRRGEKKVAAPKKIRGDRPTLPSLAAAPAEPALPPAPVEEVAAILVEPVPVIVEVQAVLAALREQAREERRVIERRCCWPIGTPGSKEFRFCDDVAEPRRSYCAKHCGVAYVVVHDRSAAHP